MLNLFPHSVCENRMGFIVKTRDYQPVNGLKVYL